VALQLVGIEVDRPQVARRSARLVGEVRGRPDRRSRRRPTRPGPSPSARTRPRPRSCCRWSRSTSSCPDSAWPRTRPASPTGPRRRARDRGLGVVEGLDDGAVVALEAVDLAPGRAPVAEVGAQAVRGLGQGRQLLGRGRALGHVVVDRHALFLGFGRRPWPTGPRPRTPPARSRSSRRPLQVPGLQRRHLFGQPGLERIAVGRLVIGLRPASGSGRRRRSGRDRRPPRSGSAG
jgi:hypothetical protein